MWIFTKYGMFSIVCARTGPSSIKLDKQRLMVRARSKRHLKNLRKRFKVLKSTKIFSNTGTDYPFRLFVKKSVWLKIAAQLADEIDYGNFKATVSYDERYHDACHRVWSTMFSMDAPESSTWELP